MEHILKELENSLKKAIESMERELGRVRTGRANLALLEGIKVEYYGVPTPLNQVAALSVPDPKTITIKPWDKKLIQAIEKAVSSDLGLSSQNDGDIIRIPIPPLTTERRKELTKQVKKIAEEYKVQLRNIRREARSKVEKSEGVSEDDQKKLYDKIDKETDKYIKEIDTIVGKKEKEIMEF